MIRSNLRGNARSAGKALVCAATYCFVFGSASIVVADDFSQRLYLNAGVGATMVEPESPNPALTISDNTDSGGHLAVGMDLNRFLTVEAYVADLGTAEAAFQGTRAGTVDYTVFGASALGYIFNSRSGMALGDDDLDGLWRREGASVYGRVGIGHMRNSAQDVLYKRDYPNHAAFGVGVEYGFNNGIALRSEIMTFDTDARYWNVGVLKRFGDVPAAPVAAAALPAVVESVAAVVEPEPKPEPAPKLFEPIQPPFIYFEFDKSDLSAESTQKLDLLAEQLVDVDMQLNVEGHTDSIAPEAYNMSLSVRRAEAVANYLESRGIDRARMRTIGYGETQPISTNNTAEGRALNRRSEIMLVKPQS